MIDKYEMKGEIKCAKSLFCQLSSSLYCLFGIPIRIPKVLLWYMVCYAVVITELLIKFQVGSLFRTKKIFFCNNIMKMYPKKEPPKYLFKKKFNIRRG